MEQQRPAYLIEIPPFDWEKTPTSVKKLVELNPNEAFQQSAIALGINSNKVINSSKNR